MNHHALIFPAIGFVLGGAVFLPVGVTIGRNVGAGNKKRFDSIEWLLVIAVVAWMLIATYPAGFLALLHV